MTKEEILKRAKPILFNTKMVRAILSGRKTQTRRVIKLKYGNTHIKIKGTRYGDRVVEIQNDVEGVTYGINANGTNWQGVLAEIEKKPQYKTGDLLYVRETWHKDAERYIYKADYSDNEKFYADGKETIIKWKPSIHMPKEAAKLFLRITNVRAERLKDISCYDVLAEGVDNGKSNSTMGKRWDNMQLMAFMELWDSTIKKSDIKKYGWDANPWVWVIEFEYIPLF